MTVLWLLVMLGSGTEPVKTIDLETVGLLDSEFLFDVNLDSSRIGVFDSAESRLIILDASGRILASTGRKGQGPGEFQWPASLSWMEEKQAFAVFDYGNTRLSLWSVEGKLLEEHKLPNGVYQGYYLGPQSILTARNTRAMRKRDPLLASYHLEAEKPSIIRRFPPKKPVIHNRIEGKLSIFNWDPRFSYARGSHFIAANFNRDDQIHIMDWSGKPKGKPFPAGLPRPALTDEHIKSRFANLPPGSLGKVEGRFIRPDYWPSVFSLSIDDRDRIWVFGAQPVEMDPIPYRVFNSKGESLGTGVFQRKPGAVRGDLAWFTGHEDQPPTLIVERVEFK